MGRASKIAIIGAGTGGLAAAMLLASKGYNVTVYEKQPYIGGRNSKLRMGEYSWDRGPTFLMMPHLLEEVFEAAGKRLDQYIQLKTLDPMYQLRFEDTHLDMTTNRRLMEERIERLFPGDGGGYRAFMLEEERKCDRVIPLLQQPFTQISDYLSMDLVRALPRLHLTDTVYGRLSRYYKDERLRYAFAFQAKYLGMSPWNCPGTFTILSYLEHRYGLFHPIGGVSSLSEAMAKAFLELGGTIHTGCGVQGIEVHRGRAIGIRLETGEFETADEIIINADFAHAAERLFKPGVLRKYSPGKLSRKRFSCSTFMMYLGVRRMVDMPHHTILFADRYKDNVLDITERGRLSENASVYIHNPSAIDPTLAPEGHSALYALMPVPNLDGQIDWERETDRAKEIMWSRIGREPELAQLRQYVGCEHTVSPQDWRDQFYVHKGATFNLAHNVGQMMYLRPRNKFEEVDGCWLVGGGTHPGSGLPTIIESAKITTAMIHQAYSKGRRNA